VNFVLEDAIAVCLVVGYTVRIASQLQLRTTVGALDTTTSFRSAIVDPRRSLGAGELWHITESIDRLLFFLRRNRISAAWISRPGPRITFRILGRLWLSRGVASR
jgi:hypothetical protein